MSPPSLALANQRSPGRRSPARWLGSLLAATGQAVLRRLEALLVFSAFFTTAVAAAVRRDSWRRPVRAVFVEALHAVAVQSAGTTLGTGLLLGLVLVTQVVYWLETAGQAQLIGTIVVHLLVQEIAPIVVGLIIFGRVGTGILVTLGEARPAGWLRQLERQGVDPMTLLVMPRMLAFSVGAFCLCTLLIVSTLVSGYLIASALGIVTVPIWRFGQNVLFAMDLEDFIIPPLKSMVIGMAIGLVCSATALARATQTYELQRLVQRGFVRAALAILVVNGVFDLAA